jgi:cytochrome P450
MIVIASPSHIRTLTSNMLFYRSPAESTQDQLNLIRLTLAGHSPKTNDAKRTIFHEILSSKLPPSDKSAQRLADEAQIVVGGGVETTAFALSIAAFHIIHNPRIYERLHADLVEALPNRSMLDLYTLEQMPYLKACVMEAVRLSYGLSARNPRTRKAPMRYGEWIIPADTCVVSTPPPLSSRRSQKVECKANAAQSMSIPDLSHDETIFPDSHAYIPERWLNDPKTADGVPLDRFMVSFGRGTRACLGINLAWTELYLTLGMLFRRYRFELHEPDVRDVQMAHDFFIPVTRLDGKGVRVFVEGCKD